MISSANEISSSLVAHYERCLDQYGDTPAGVDWPNEADATRRYRVMLEVIRHLESGLMPSLLDVGCGAAHLYEHILRLGQIEIEYSGLDLSENFINLCRSKFPDRTFYQMGLLDPQVLIPQFDYVVLNGVLTEKRDIPFDPMWEYTQRLLIAAWGHARMGMAFNLMSKQVDWEREDLFHVPLDMIADFVSKNLSRHFLLRRDYGLYEYTVYVYRNPRT